MIDDCCQAAAAVKLKWLTTTKLISLNQEKSSSSGDDGGKWRRWRWRCSWMEKFAHPELKSLLYQQVVLDLWKEKKKKKKKVAYQATRNWHPWCDWAVNELLEDDADGSKNFPKHILDTPPSLLPAAPHYLCQLAINRETLCNSNQGRVYSCPYQERGEIKKKKKKLKFSQPHFSFQMSSSCCRRCF